MVGICFCSCLILFLDYHLIDIYFEIALIVPLNSKITTITLGPEFDDGSKYIRTYMSGASECVCGIYSAEKVDKRKSSKSRKKVNNILTTIIIIIIIITAAAAAAAVEF